MESAVQEITSQLRERQKELRCLYRFASLVEESGEDLPQICRGLTRIIPEALCYPEKTSVQIDLRGDSYCSDDFVSSSHSYSQKMSSGADVLGQITVFISGTYSLPPFLKEEQDLIDYIAKRTGRIIQRIETLQELKRKNMALSEILDHLQESQTRRDDNIRGNLEMIIYPILDKMEQAAPELSYLPLLRSAIADVFSSFGISIKKDLSLLTNREVEICNFIKNGLTSEEIGDLLSISAKTVGKHRFHIRKKLGLLGESVNLSSYLRLL